MNLMPALKEANPGIESGTVRLEQRTRRWLDLSATASTHSIAQKWYVSYANGSHPISITIVIQYTSAKQRRVATR